MLTFSQKSQAIDRRTLIYTAVPPPRGAPPRVVEARLTNLHEISKRVPIDAINIPEVRPESRNPPVTPFVPKMEPRRFAHLVQRELPRPVEIILDRSIVHTPWHNQRKWLLKSWRTFGIRTLLLVGGESSQIRYPGPSVTQAARLIHQDNRMHYSCGGIVIPTRRQANPRWDEPHRLIEKARSGLEFFISQVIYEPDSVKTFLMDYHHCCLQEKVEPKRIFLSFAPISSERDARFLQRWRVVIPPKIEQFILKNPASIAARSIQTSGAILEEILDFTERQKLHIPLGLNIEHVNSRNLQAALDMAIHLNKLYRCPKLVQV
jgi:hypothetical protein